jgi:hypothetical protein
MAELLLEEGNVVGRPDRTGYNRDDKGRFVAGVSGNLAGRPKGSLSITELIKHKLNEIPDGEGKTYLELLIERILDKAIEGDYQMIKQIWEHLDGRPKESVEMSGETRLPYVIKIVKYGEENEPIEGTTALPNS